MNRFPEPSSGRPRVVIVGGGFAGIAAAKTLSDCEVTVTLIDQRNHHIFQPLLYQVATGMLAPSDIATPIRQLARRQRNLSVMLAEATGCSADGRSLMTHSPELGASSVPFDYLILAPGMQASYFGHDGFAHYAPGLKSIADAELMRAKLLSAFELAEQSEDPTERKRQLTIVLVGAGPTGVELAATIAGLAHATLRSSFRRIEPGDCRIVLIEAGKRILPSFDEVLSSKATQRLVHLGVEVRTASKVDDIDAHGVILAGERIGSATVLWTAGVASVPIIKALNAETDRAGRVCVLPNLEVPGRPGVFVVGDAAALSQDGHPLPGVAQVAIQQGRYVGRLIRERVVGGGPPEAFRYLDKGNMAVVGRNFALLQSRWLQMGGFLTFLIWGTLHLMLLPQLQSRLRVAGEWLWWSLTNQRSALLIPQTNTEKQAGETKLVARSLSPNSITADQASSLSTREHPAHG